MAELDDILKRVQEGEDPADIQKEEEGVAASEATSEDPPPETPPGEGGTEESTFNPTDLLGDEVEKEVPSDKETNFSNLRSLLEAEKKSNQELKETNEKLQKAVSQVDIRLSPEFQKEFDAPLMELQKSFTAGIGHLDLPAEVAGQLNQMSLTDLTKTLNDYQVPSVLQNRLVSDFLKMREIAASRQEVLTHNSAAQEEYISKMRSEKANHVQNLAASRNQAIRGGIDAAFSEGLTLLGEPGTPEEKEALKADLQEVVNLVNNAGQDPQKGFENQVKNMVRGVRYGALDKEYKELRGKYNDLLQKAKAQGIVTDHKLDVEVKGGSAPAPENPTFEELTHALKSGQMAPGGSYDAMSKR